MWAFLKTKASMVAPHVGQGKAASIQKRTSFKNLDKR